MTKVLVVEDDKAILRGLADSLKHEGYEVVAAADGEAGYLRWLAANHPGYFAALYGKLLAREVNQKVEEKTVVHYETLEERRAAMIAKGWAPTAVAALEEAMEPKFLRDMRESMREENEGQGEAN